MVDDITDNILQAWHRIRPSLLCDQHDLAKRLARRRTPTLTRPPRAWCLAVRASDSRIHGEFVEFTAALLQRLCAHTTIHRLYLNESAEQLGTTKTGLTNARLKNILHADHYPLLGGRRGKPIPLLTARRPLDPNAHSFALADDAWAWTARHLTDRIPADFCQTLQRVPHHLSHVRKGLYDEHRHPELDLPLHPRISKRLPPPKPDHATWYKWSRSGHYLGDDPANWRKSFQDLGERPPRYKRKPPLPSGEGWGEGEYQERPHRKARPSTSSGSLHFNGFFWLCPICHKKCRTLYLPLKPINLLDNLPRLAQIIDIPRKQTGFACHRCHHIRFFSRLPAEAWNQLVAYLTAGLLYGREVPRPIWFTNDRKRAYKPQSHPRSATRREQVLELLLKGHSHQKIADALNIRRSALTPQLDKIYKSERVHSHRALLLKHNRPMPAHLTSIRHRILARLQSGILPDEIARELGIQCATVHRHIRTLRHENTLPKRLTKRQKVAQLRAQGLSRHQIAARLHMTPQSVSTRLSELRRTIACAGKV